MLETVRRGLYAALIALPLSLEPSWAHSPIDHTTPAHGTAIANLPDQLVFHFRRPAMLTALEIRTGDGTVATLDFERDAVTLQWAVPYTVDHIGPHTVTWRALSADGHPVAGELTFTVTP